jgi:catechol 2,3-dioxygenase-like lactoylglutathione lyase family enzyme
MINAIHHVAISTGDMERSLKFYRDLLGLEVIMEGGWESGSPESQMAEKINALKAPAAKMALLKTGNAMIEIFEYSSPQPKSGDPNRPVCDHGITHICLDVTDLDAEYDRLKAAGMTFHCPPQMLGRSVKTTYGRDPDGNVVELQEILWEGSRLALG